MKPNKNPGLLQTAVLCMTELLNSVTHFNFRVNLITAIAKKMIRKGFPETTRICSEGFARLFKNDEHGEPTVEAVKVLTSVFKKANHDVPPAALDCFLSLHLQHPVDSEQPKKQATLSINPRKRKAEAHVSKKMRKVNEFQRQVDMEMKEAEAAYDKEETKRYVFQVTQRSEALKHLFQIYFRILKQSQNSSLLPKVLEGLSKFASLINIDFFEDLLNVLKGISVSQIESYMEGYRTSTSSALSALHCIIAAFELMDAVGDSLNVDLKDFYTLLYMQMPRLAVATGSADSMPSASKGYFRSEMDLFIQGVESLFLKKRSIPPERAAAFTKRLAILAMNAPANAGMAYLALLKKAVKRFPQFESFFEEDGRLGAGTYDAYTTEPDACNAFTTSIWEAAFLTVQNLTRTTTTQL
jgi:nucleolar complex protein 3